MTDLRQSRGRAFALRTAAVLIAIVTLAVVANTREGDSTSRIIGAVAGLAGLFAVVALWDQASRHLAPLADEVIARDTRPPVLYLRSFESDHAVSAIEEVLASMLDRVGPFITIGQPGEKLPKLGAARKYVGEQDWKPYIATTLSAAALVVLRAGRTSGLGWEVGQCVRRLDPRRLVVLVPADREQFDAFRLQARQSGLVLPEHPSRQAAPYHAGEFCGLLRFTEDWQPRFLPFQKAAWSGTSHEIPTASTRFAARLQIALAGVMAPLGIPWEEPPRAWLFMGGMIFSAVLLVFIAVLAWLVLTGRLQ